MRARACVPTAFRPFSRLAGMTFLKFVLTNKHTVCCVWLCVFQWVDHPGRLLISTGRHGDPRADRAEEEEDRGGNGWVSVVPLSAPVLNHRIIRFIFFKKKKKSISRVSTGVFLDSQHPVLRVLELDP